MAMKLEDHHKQTAKLLLGKLGAAMAVAGDWFEHGWKAKADNPVEETDLYREFEEDPFNNGFQANGPEGPGYYEGGFKLHD